MAKWSMYAEFMGYPLEVDFVADDDMDESDVWDMVSQHIEMTLEVTKED